MIFNYPMFRIHAFLDAFLPLQFIAPSHCRHRPEGAVHPAPPVAFGSSTASRPSAARILSSALITRTVPPPTGHREERAKAKARRVGVSTAHGSRGEGFGVLMKIAMSKNWDWGGGGSSCRTRMRKDLGLEILLGVECAKRVRPDPRWPCVVTLAQSSRPELAVSLSAWL